MFLRATNGEIINLDHYGNVRVYTASGDRFREFDARIAIDAQASNTNTGNDGFYEIVLWEGNETEANDKMAELWQAIQNSEWAFDFGQNGTPRPVEEKPAHQPLPDDFGF